MDFFTNNISVVLFFPVWVCMAICSCLIFKLSENRHFTTLLTILSTTVGLIFSVGLLKQVCTPDKKVIEENFLWFSGQNMDIYMGSLIDSTSAIFLVILMLISLLVQIYSYGYMQNEKDFNRYYLYLNFFNFAMTGLILSPNLIQMYIFWELVGVASYLLIGFFYKKEDVSISAKKVFFINRIGDFSFLLGIITLLYFSITYLEPQSSNLVAFTNIDMFQTQLTSLTSDSTYNLICLLLIIGAFVKSAQFPFQTWLIDAMKAPTPVSALIHSATMVCMGVFLIIRIFPLLTNELLNIILIVGLLTALVSGFIAIGQNNLKKLLAYSTSSQLGLMFVALGLGSTSAAIIYLVIHSFTKALLFLCTGSISQIYNSIELEQISALKKIDFPLSLYWLIGALSLSGLFFGGFTSKEMLIEIASKTQNNAILIIILLASFLSTFYIFRTYFKISNGDLKNTYINQRKKTMLTTIMILSIFVIFPGFMFNFSKFNMLCILALGIGICAIFSAFFSSRCNKIPMPKTLIYLAENELFIPHIYNRIGNIFIFLCKITNLFDKYIIDNFVELHAKCFQKASVFTSKYQNGNIQYYIAYSIFTIGIIFAIILYLYIRTLRG